MMVTKLTTVADNKRSQVSEILAEVAEMGFDEVIVFGFKDNKIHTKRSQIGDTLRTVGALEMAKHDLLKD